MLVKIGYVYEDMDGHRIIFDTKYDKVNANKFNPKKYKKPSRYDYLIIKIGLKNVKKYDHLFGFMDKIKDLSYLNIYGWWEEDNKYLFH
jgi:hypothetical protein